MAKSRPFPLYFRRTGTETKSGVRSLGIKFYPCMPNSSCRTFGFSKHQFPHLKNGDSILCTNRDENYGRRCIKYAFKITQEVLFSLQKEKKRSQTTRNLEPAWEEVAILGPWFPHVQS